MRCAISILFLYTIFINTVDAAAIAKSLKCKSTSFITCSINCEISDSNIPVIIIDQGNRELTREINKEKNSYKILKISKTKKTNGTLIFYKDENGLSGVTYITELRIFFFLLYGVDKTFISTGTCIQK